MVFAYIGQADDGPNLLVRAVQFLILLGVVALIIMVWKRFSKPSK